MKILLQCLAILIGLTAFVPLIPSPVWWIRGFEFPRMQLMLLKLVIGIGLIGFGFENWMTDGGVALFLVIAFAYQFWRVRPFSPLVRRQVLAARNGSGLSLLVANVLMKNRKADKLIVLVREKRPDLLLAVETDEWWTTRLRALQDEYPHAVEVPQPDTYGMVLRSRLPLEEAVVERLVRPHIPSIHTKIRLKSGHQVRFYAVHPKPPYPDEATTTVNRDAELLIVGKRAAAHGGPTIVAGDLNDVAWSRTTTLFQKISGLLDPRVGRGCFNTYHAEHWWLRWPLDHIFLSPHFRLRRLELQPGIGSDHFPILADLSFEPERQHRQRAPEEDEEDLKESREKIERADAGDRGLASPSFKSRRAPLCA